MCVLCLCEHVCLWVQSTCDAYNTWGDQLVLTLDLSCLRQGLLVVPHYVFVRLEGQQASVDFPVSASHPTPEALRSQTYTVPAEHGFQWLMFWFSHFRSKCFTHGAISLPCHIEVKYIYYYINTKTTQHKTKKKTAIFRRWSSLLYFCEFLFRWPGRSLRELFKRATHFL